MAWLWVEPQVRRSTRSYVKIRPDGLYVSMRAEEVPWPRQRVRIVVGFEQGRLAIRLSDEGRSIYTGYTRRRWGGYVAWAGIAELAEAYGLPVGVPIPARYEADADMIVAERPTVVEPQGTGL